MVFTYYSQGASYIATLFDGNELMAIIDAYPELNLEEKKFEFLPRMICRLSLLLLLCFMLVCWFVGLLFCCFVACL